MLVDYLILECVISNLQTEMTYILNIDYAADL